MYDVKVSQSDKPFVVKEICPYGSEGRGEFESGTASFSYSSVPVSGGRSEQFRLTLTQKNMNWEEGDDEEDSQYEVALMLFNREHLQEFILYLQEQVRSLPINAKED